MYDETTHCECPVAHVEGQVCGLCHGTNVVTLEADAAWWAEDDEEDPSRRRDGTLKSAACICTPLVANGKIYHHRDCKGVD